MNDVAGQSAWKAAVRYQTMANSYTPVTGEEPLKRLLPDSADFQDFISSNAVLVDKTDLIRDLLNSSPIRTFFLSRPRRFGKTLLLDTIQNIAQGDRKPFSSFHIGKEGSGYVWEPYPVIRMSFSRFESNPKIFRGKLLSTLDDIAMSHNLDIPPARTVSDIDAIISALSKKHSPAVLPNTLPGIEPVSANVVLLIDEYDFPLLNCLDNPGKAEKIRSMLRVFYSTIKDCRKKLRFTFITGITKLSGLSMFSGMNSVVDISMDPHYSSICGFTDEEISSNFHCHILAALPQLSGNNTLPQNSTDQTFMDELKFWYDGYSWDGKIKIYNPFSIINCLWKQKFDHYWYNSGTSIASFKFRCNTKIYNDLFINNLRARSLDPIGDLTGLNTESFLFQAGYATIDRIEIKFRIMDYILKCPNNEIAYALAKDFGQSESPFPGIKGAISEQYTAFIEAFEASDADECARLFSSLLGKAALALHNPNEYTYQFLLFTLLNVRGYSARLEQYVGEGRADILYSSPASRFQIVIEIKRAAAVSTDDAPAFHESPSPGSVLPGFPELSEPVRQSLEDGIAEAASQVLARNYVRPFYLEGETRVCAVAVHGWGHSMFRFFKVDWKSRTIQMPVPKETP
ncbi:MAG: AAA family ATPase [Deltaproteobacteria bacterium]|jgi:hypothetical protein|nr:AAA family ATPase [Deltaproteobacteria bacterium]